jgi:uncharacterized phage protein (TIGR01671 family)
MRDIKFRVWDKFEKRMYKVEKIEWNCFGEITHIGVYENDSLCKSYTKNHNVERHDIIALEIMQYTGLHGKNGKEIYEGDIIKLKKIEIVSKDYIPPYDYEIIKEKGKLKTIATYETLIAGYDTRENAFRYKDKKGNFTTLIDCDIEVLGNIYDNPELLSK